MRLRTDLVLLALAVVFAGVGVFLSSQASFAANYVRDQLAAEKIAFSPADKLTAEEKNWKPGSSCLVDYAGQELVTGPQAECYANYFINVHMAESATNVGYPGATYATLGSAQSDLRAQIATAQKNNDATAAAAAQKKLDAVTATRESLFKGDMLRSALLTVYGFSVLGSVAGTAATLAYAGAALFVAIAAYAFLRGRAPAVVVQPEGARVATR